MPAHASIRPIVSSIIRFLAVLLMLLAGAFTGIQPAFARPAAAVIRINSGTVITVNTTWSKSNIYYILGDMTVNPGVRLTIEPGTIIKFNAPYPLPTNRTTLTVYGELVLPKLVTEAPVIFTSGRDDQRGGDTNGDGTQTSVYPGDWDGVVISYPTSTQVDITRVEVYYADRGLVILNSGSVTIAPPVHDNRFSNSNCGMTLSVESTGGNNAVVSKNLFQDNEFGFCTAATTGAVMAPKLTSNTFKYNRQLPIYLYGTAYPAYPDIISNTFIGYDAPNDGHLERHLGIGLGGTIFSSGTWEIVKGYNNIDMPYVVVSKLTIADGVTVKILPGTTIKFFTRDECTSVTKQCKDVNKDSELPSLTISGNIELPPLSSGKPAIFTSYHDDVNGDTNGDAQNNQPQPGDWYQVYYPDDTKIDPLLRMENAEFRYAVNGLSYEATETNINHAPVFSHLRFQGNVNGLRLKIATDKDYPNTVLKPVIEYCTFDKNGRVPVNKYQVEHGVPIFLINTVQPTYTGNTFNQNLHPAIGVAGTWLMNTTWESITGQGIARLPYLVHDDVTLGTADTQGKDDSMSLTLPAGTTVVFNVNHFDAKYKSRIIAYGKLDLLSAKGSNPVIFTSIYDNNPFDMSADPIQPLRTDWTDVEVHHPDSHFDNIIVRYASEGLHLYNKGTYLLSPPVVNSTFENNTKGLQMAVTSSGDITSQVENNIFRSNDFGLVTWASTTSTGISKPVLLKNSFISHSQFPIYLAGSASPVYQVDPATGKPNTFQNNVHRAIALGGYFGSVDDPIFLPRVPGDTNAPFNGKTFPYVVLADTTFDWQTQTHMNGGLVFKAAKGTFIKFFGSLDMTTSTASGNQNTFTAYVDDVYDDTDAAAQPATIARTYWDGLYLFNPATLSFSFSTMKYATYGLVVFQPEPADKNYSYIGDMDIDVTNNGFVQNQHGLTFQIESIFDIYANVQNNVFQGNDYGLYTYANPKTVHLATIFPDLVNNNFTGQVEFPIYLRGTTSPNYHVGETGKKNSFSNNTHKGIAVGGHWANDSRYHPPITWTRVPGDDGKYFPYVVLENVELELIQLLPTPVYTTIILPAQTLIKLDADKYIYALGKLEFNSTSDENKKIVFTSYLDDTVYFTGDPVNQTGGDTNADGTKTTPKRNSWNSVWLMDFPGKYHQVHDTITKYAVSGFVIFYNGIDNANIPTEISQAQFIQVHTAISSVVGWWKQDKEVIGGIGNVNAMLTDILIKDSDYGLITAAHPNSTGVNRPTLTRVTFSNIDFYPIFLGGTSEPIFASGNQVIPKEVPLGSEAGIASLPEMTEPVLDIQGPDVSALTELQQPLGINEPPANHAASSDNNALLVSGPGGLTPAIGLGGYWNNAVTLPALGDLPYAIVGKFPVKFGVGDIWYTPTDDVFVGAKHPTDTDYVSFILQPGTIFKFDAGRQMTFMQYSTLTTTDVAGKPAVFTSMKDDAAGGDTNHDTARTIPTKGDWIGVKVSSANPAFVFQNAVVRYAAEGLHLFYEGELMTKITLQVNGSQFLYNTVGVTLTANSNGDLSANLSNNQFSQNGTHILGKPTQVGYAGRLFIAAHNNDLLGGKAQVGIVNQNINDVLCNPHDSTSDCDFDASQNYWGEANNSGPYHPNQNTTGLGSTVSDRVKFRNWLSKRVSQPTTFTISGQVTEKMVNNPGLVAVTITLVPLNRKASTDEGGMYSFQDVPPGSYTLIASRDGYTFTPQQIFIQNLSSDAAGLNFQSTVMLAGRTVSAESSSLLAWPGDSHTVYIRVLLDKPNDIGKNIQVTYTILDGTANGGLPTATGVDFTYTKKTATLTFKPGEQEKTISIVLKPRPKGTPDQFFTIELTNPVNVQTAASLGMETIKVGYPQFLPTLRK